MDLNEVKRIYLQKIQQWDKVGLLQSIEKSGKMITVSFWAKIM